MTLWPKPSVTMPLSAESREKALKLARVTAEKVENASDEKRLRIILQFRRQSGSSSTASDLALNRGEKEGVLKVRVIVDERDWRSSIYDEFQEDLFSPFSDQLSLSIMDAADRLLLPSIERDVRRELGEKADNHAINVFATNLRALLSIPPLAGHTVLGIDPGVRTGCKVAVVDPTGKLLDTERFIHTNPGMTGKDHWQHSRKWSTGIM